MTNQVAYYGPASNIDEALQRLASHDGFIACDTETVSIKDRRLIGIGFAWGTHEAIYFMAWQGEGHPEHAPNSAYFFHAIQTLHDKRPKIGWNFSFDLDSLEPLVGELSSWEDASIACRVQALPNSLEDTAADLWGDNHQVISDILTKKPNGDNIQNMLLVDPRKVAWKCLMDCTATYKAWEIIKGPLWLSESTEPHTWTHPIFGNKFDVTVAMKKAYALDRALIPVLRRMGKKGVKLNKERLLAHYHKLAAEKFQYQSFCQQQLGFEPGSNQQAGYILALRGNMLPWTKNGKYKRLRVDEETLLGLSDPLARIILEYRDRADDLSDVIEKYLGKPKGVKGKRVPYTEWEAWDRVPSHWRLDLATGRLASYEDNLQNKKASLRDVFEPDSGTWTWWDASQIEMRIFADMSEDPALLDAYRNNESVHLMTMHALFPGEPRYLCCGFDKCSCNGNNENPLYIDSKTFNFAMIYFAIAQTLAKQTRRPVEVCQQLSERWLVKYRGGYRFMLDCVEHSVDHDWIETYEGRRIRLPDAALMGEDHKGKCDINYRVQGTAAWPIKVAMIQQDKDGIDMRIQVHDETVNDGDYDIEQTDLADFMGFPLLKHISTPIETKKGPIWA